MKTKMIIPFAALAVCCILSGCVSAPPPEACDLETSVQILMEKMLGNPQFTKNYNAAKKAKDALPVVCQSPIVNKTPNAECRSVVRAADDLVRVALFDTGAFEVKDDGAADMMLSRIVWGADGGIENTSALMNAVGGHDAPDFIVSGDLQQSISSGGYPTYRLRLAIYNLKTGKIVWEGIQRKIKLQ